MQVCAFVLMNLNDFNEICGQIQRVPPLIIFKDFTFSKNPFGITWVAWKGAAQYSRWSISIHIDSNLTPLPFGLHFWICPGGLESIRSILQIVNSGSHPGRSRNEVQKGTVPDLDQCALELTIWSTERALPKLPRQIQKWKPKGTGAQSSPMCLGIGNLEY